MRNNGLLLLTIALVLAVALGVYALMNRPISPRTDFVQKCIIANKELPRPDLYCIALWDQGER